MRIKKILSTALALLMVITALPLTAISSNAYSSYETESNDTYATADVLPLNSSIAGNSKNSYDEDVYKIMTSQNGRLSLTFTHQYGDSSWYIYVYQYKNGQYTEMFSRQYIDATDTAHSLMPIGVVANGVYYIKVKCNGGSGEYELKNSFSATEYYEREINSTFATATKMSLNKTYRGSANDAYDEDVYKIMTSQNGRLSLTFTHQYGDSSWYIYVYQYKNGQYTEMFSRQYIDATDTAHSLTPIGVVANGVYYIKVKCNGGSGEYSLTISNQLPKPTPKVANKNGYVSVTWNKSAGATGYYVYRKGPNDKSWVRIANVTGTAYNDKNVKSGSNYVYTVRAFNGNVSSSYHSGVAIKYLARPTFKASNQNGYVRIAWNKVAGATGYYVYRKAPNAKSWTRIATVTGTAYNDKNVKSGSNYVYTVRAFNGKFTSTFHSGLAIKYLARPTFKVANKSNNVTVSWSNVAGAKGYYVYRKAGNATSWTRVATVTGTAYNDKNVTSGSNYVYTVRAFNGKFTSTFHSGLAIKYLARPTFKVANKSNNVTVSWSNVAGAKGYYVYRKAGNATSWTRVATVTGTAYADKNVKKNVKYTYTVKAYNGKYTSTYHSGAGVKH